MSKKGLLFAFAVIMVSLFASTLVFAMNDSRDDTSAIFHTREQRTAPQANGRWVGELACKLATQNNGEPCELTFTEKSTGKVYQLSQAQAAMALYQAGQRKVAIRGQALGSNQIGVASAEPQVD